MCTFEQMHVLADSIQIVSFQVEADRNARLSTDNQRQFLQALCQRFDRETRRQRSNSGEAATAKFAKGG